MTRWWSGVFVVALLAGGAVTSSCSGGNSSSPTTPTPTQTTPTPTRIIGLSGNLAFGDVQVGTSATTTLTLSNSGNSTLTWSGLSTGDAVFEDYPPSGTVAAGASQDITLTFTPAAATSYSSTLTVTSDATSGTNTITVSGTGTTAPVAE
ncbi:MAG: choice-of-anchor D domain-containing protein, partial [Vicinamibacterales bacterium]|nr:choice-of-anchor D domain-containing protein [Vicinamibacterales bacterium]